MKKFIKNILHENLKNLINEAQYGKIIAYHGSQKKISKKDGFLTKYILSGEGNNIFGWGLYFTDIIDVAKLYARNNASNQINRLLSLANEFDVEIVGDMMDFFEMHDKWDSAPKELKKIILDPKNKNKKLTDLIDKGYLYHVTITPSKPNALEWYENISEDELKKFDYPDYSNKSITGSQLYSYLKQKLGSDKEASLSLYQNGYFGIVYPTGTISDVKYSNVGKNYVIFNDNDVTIDKVTRLI